MHELLFKIISSNLRVREGWRERVSLLSLEVYSTFVSPFHW